MLHEQAGAAEGCLQLFNFLLVESERLAGRLPLREGIVHLCTGIEQGLLESKQGFFLLGFGYAEVGNVLSFIE